ncbi:hypothetical protein [Streptomyces sp. NPDC002851]
MNRAVAALARAGDVWDAVTATPARVRLALRDSRRRLVALAVVAVLLGLYLTAIGDVVFGAHGRWAGQFAGWERAFETRAPYLFEPVAAVRTPVAVLFVSPVNVLLGAVVAGLAACTVAVALATRDEAVCPVPVRRRGRGFGGLLGALPALLLGFACCVPAFLLALGTGTAAAVLPFVTPLRPVFYPLSLLLLSTALVWGARRLRS